MAGSATLAFDRGDYVRLLEALPPVKIRTSEQAEATEEQIEELLARPALSGAERAGVDPLRDQLAVWEDAGVAIPDVRGVELVRAAGGAGAAPAGAGGRLPHGGSHVTGQRIKVAGGRQEVVRHAASGG